MSEAKKVKIYKKFNTSKEFTNDELFTNAQQSDEFVRQEADNTANI